MPTLDWIGKQAVVKHHADVPYRLLEPVPELSFGDHHGDANSGNLIVQGDNLHALKALLPRYAGQVKCIYIDPPYNTGNEGWVYNDNVNSPEIRKWLHDTVGKQGEDLSRHDKWLCMMYPRLMLLKQFLRRDGVIWISIDDAAVALLRCLMDELFGIDKFIACNIWQKRYSRENREAIGDVHEYVVLYAMNPAIFKSTRHKVPIDEKQAKVYRNPNNDPKGRWRPIPMTAQAGHATSEQFYEIVTPSGKRFRPPEGRCWGLAESTFNKLRAEGRIYFGKNGNSQPNVIRYLSEVEGVVPWTWWPHEEVGHNDEATKEVMGIFGGESKFGTTPKPSRLIQRMLQISTDRDSLILDSFTGSGTTAHAVLKQNAEDGGNRKFILVEMEADIARNVTAERVRRVAAGYTNAKGKAVAGLGGGFQYCKLSEEPLFDATGAVRDDVRFDQLAEFVWFSETGSGFGATAASPLIGVDGDNSAVYLLYNGILKDRSPGGGNVLTHAVLRDLPAHDGPKVIYAAACRLGDKRLAAEGIVFKQTPYALGV